MNQNFSTIIGRIFLLGNLALGGIALVVLDSAIGFATPQAAIAQITPDNTLGDESSVVNPRDATSDSIDGGAQRGQNLFHSFEEFNVDAGRGVYFSNPDAVTNIFSRVTGDNVSNILGTLGVDGAANLFLINPNGIIFGADSSLDVQGSFTATTANEIGFGEQGKFSTINPQVPQLLTVNPSAYLFNQIADQNINGIQSQGFLVIPNNNNLTLIGGNINLDGNGANAGLYAPGGHIQIGGLVTTGEIIIDNNDNLIFPDDIAKSNVLLTNFANLNVLSTTGGNIKVEVNDLKLSTSILLAGVDPGQTIENNSAGDIIINASNEILLDGSFITNQVSSTAIGNSGTVNITTNFLSLTNGSNIQTISTGMGNAGDINLEIADTLNLIASNISSGVTFAQGDGGNISLQVGNLINLSQGSVIFSGIFSEGIGNGGEINIVTDNLILTENSQITAGLIGEPTSGFAGAIGNAGDINIEIADTLTLVGQSLINSGVVFSEGDGGDINLRVGNSINLSRGSFISSAILQEGIGVGGDVNITTTNLSLTEASQITASLIRDETGLAGAKGKAGNIIITAFDSINISGTNPDGFSSGLFSSVERGTVGEGGDIRITTNHLRLVDGAVINAQTFNSDDGGNIFLDVRNLEAVDGGQILTLTRSGGNAGKINIIAEENITLSGQDLNFNERFTQFGRDIVNNQGANSGIFANGDIDATGNGGQIEIQTSSLTLDNTAQITSENEGGGNAGGIIIGSSQDFSLEQLSLTDSNITTAANRGSGGAINLSAENISLRGNSNITTNVNNGEGGGGNITLTAESITAFNDSDIFAFAADGRGGDISLDTPAFFGENFTLNSLTSDPNELEGNSRVDINATGAVSGLVEIPDVTSIQNSLIELPDDAINTDELVANSCVVRSREQNGTFIITGRGGFPLRPGEAGVSDYSTGEVRNVPDTESRWQPGDAIIEPQKIYRLTDGKLVLSRECN